MKKGSIFILLIMLASLTTAGFVSVKEDKLILDEQEFYPFGVNYFPSYYNRSEGFVESDWLDDSYNKQGNREQIEKELDKVSELGMNFIIITNIWDTKYCDNLNDFLDLAKERGLKVSIFPHSSDPLYNYLGFSNYKEDIEIIKECNLPKREVILGFEIDWEPSFESRWGETRDLPYSGKRRNKEIIRDDWNEWVVKYYGGVSQAYENWNYNPVSSQNLGSIGIAHTVQPRTQIGIKYDLNFTMKNMGKESWERGTHRLNFLGIPLEVPKTVKTGEEVMFTLPYVIPGPENAEIETWWQMQKGTEFFGDRYYAKTKFVYSDPTYPLKSISVEEVLEVPTPTDEHFCNEGDWTAYVAAFNHFRNDLVGNEYRKMIDEYKKIDKNHLIYSHMGGTPGATWEPICYNLEYNERWSVGKYLDVMSEEIYNPVQVYNEEGFEKVMTWDLFQASYQYIGKPSIIVESGLTNNCYPASDCSKENQTRFHEELNKMILTSNYNGLAIWWFTGKSKSDWMSKKAGRDIFDDGGLVEPYTLEEYPVAKKMREMSAEMKSERSPNWDSTLIVDPDRYSNIYEFSKDASTRFYNKVQNGKNPRVITTCTDKDSSDVEIVCVGNTENDGLCPVKCLQSRILSFEIKDKAGKWKDVLTEEEIELKEKETFEVKVLIENTQEPKWLKGDSKGSVQLIAKQDGKIVSSAELDNNIEGLSDLSEELKFKSGFSSSGKTTFRLYSKDRTEFGDHISINIKLEKGEEDDGDNGNGNNGGSKKKPKPSTNLIKQKLLEGLGILNINLDLDKYKTLSLSMPLNGSILKIIYKNETYSFNATYDNKTGLLIKSDKHEYNASLNKPLKIKLGNDEVELKVTEISDSDIKFTIQGKAISPIMETYESIKYYLVGFLAIAGLITLAIAISKIKRRNKEEIEVVNNQIKDYVKGISQ